MKKTIKALRRGIKAAMAAPEPQKFRAGGKTVMCSHCGNGSFLPYELTKIATKGLLCELHGLLCAKCSHLEFFAQEPEEIDNPAA